MDCQSSARGRKIFETYGKSEFIYNENEWLSDTEVPDKMIDSQGMSSEPDIEEKSLTEEICVVSYPDVKIEHGITTLIVPKIERENSPFESYEDFGRDVSRGGKDELNYIGGVLQNDSSSCSQQSNEGRLHPPSVSSLLHKGRELASIHNNVRSSTCGSCHEDFRSKRHVTNHSKGRPFICSECGRRFKIRYSLTNHFRIHNNVQPYRCSSCYKYFRHEWYWNVHSEDRPYNCDVCGRGFEVQDLDNVRPYTCSSCKIDFRSKGDLNIHMRIHSEGRPYVFEPCVCDECGRGFTNYRNLLSHIKIRNNFKLFTCNTSASDFRNIKYLSHHLDGHSDAGSYTCNECGKGFESRISMLYHLKAHIIHNAYKCFKKFPSRRAFWDHKLIR